MIRKNMFQTDEQDKEILFYDPEEYPYLCNYTEIDAVIGNSFPWHWHEEFEINYVCKGTIEVQVGEKVFTVRRGEALFLKSNVLHLIRRQADSPSCKIYVQQFRSDFLTGAMNNIYEKKYLTSLLQCQHLDAFHICPDSHRNIKMLDRVLNTIELNEREPFGYEFEVRSELCRFWCLLLEETTEYRMQASEEKAMNSDRVKQMMHFIQDNYMRRLTLSDIARSSSVSARECSRCFQKNIAMSPMSYLNNFRIQKAAEMLQQTEHSILFISSTCGFSTSSYFCKVFSAAMHCSPSEYRKRTGEYSASYAAARPL